MPLAGGCHVTVPPGRQCSLPDCGRKAVEPGVYPEDPVERERWVARILDGTERKRPVASWQMGHVYQLLRANR